MSTRIGLIGLGDIAGKVYLPLLANDPSVHIAGVASRSLSTVERIAGQYRIAGRGTSVKELLDFGVDAVFVHSPTETHFDIVTECLSAGVDVYVDKPLSYSLEESERMAALALERGRLLAVGFNRRFAPLYMEARSWLAEVGGFDLIVAQKQRTKLQKLSARHTFYDDLIHMLDLIVWLGGDKFVAAAQSQRTDGEGRLIAASGTVAFPYPQSAEAASAAAEGASAQYSMIRLAGSDLEKLELHGGGRSAEVVNLESAVLSGRAEGRRTVTFGSWDSILHRRGFAGAVEHFLRCIGNPEACTIRADQVLPTHRLVERLASEV
jgi:virulence factor